MIKKIYVITLSLICLSIQIQNIDARKGGNISNPYICGSISFEAQPQFDIEMTSPKLNISGDFDSDGDNDIILVDNGNELHLLQNDSFGSFSNQLLYSSSEYEIEQLKRIEADNDGDLDFVISLYSNTNDFSLTIAFINTPDYWEPLVIGSNFGGESLFDTADLNNDGYEDIIIANANTIYWSENNFGEKKGFDNPVLLRTLNSNIDKLKVGYLTSSQRVDAIVQTSNQNLVLLRSIYYVRDLPLPYVIDNRSFEGDIWLSDMNKDGLQDIVIKSGTIGWYKNLRQIGIFSKYMKLVPVSPTNYAISDLDQDGDNDVVVVMNTQIGTDWAAYYLNNGSGKFNVNNYLQFANLSNPTETSIMNINSDIFPDLVINNSANGLVKWYQNTLRQPNAVNTTLSWSDSPGPDMGTVEFSLDDNCTESYWDYVVIQVPQRGTLNSTQGNTLQPVVYRTDTVWSGVDYFTYQLYDNNSNTYIGTPAEFTIVRELSSTN